MSTSDNAVELVVQADDYGMHPAVTDGVDRLFESGIVTQASVMAPAPDASRALASAFRTGMPLGVHLTLACEWDFYRWSPLTAAPTLRAADGAFLPGIPELRSASVDEAYDELVAQVEAVVGAGLSPQHMESHIRPFDLTILAELSSRYGLESRDPIPHPGLTMRLDSLWHLSVQPPETKLASLLDHVATLPSGRHMIVAHPAEDHDDLRRFCPPTSRRWKWAREIRVSDSAALSSPEFAASCRDLGISLSATHVPRQAPSGDPLSHR